MGLLSNGEEMTAARRNKYLMGEAVRASGIRAVKQKHAYSMEDIEQFFVEHTPNVSVMVVFPGALSIFVTGSYLDVRVSRSNAW
jgi:hypothetical protein